MLARAVPTASTRQQRDTPFCHRNRVAVTPRNLHLLSNIAGGASGMCYGDSGAPRLFKDGDETILLATSWWLGTYCQAPEQPLRLDTRQIHDWLESVVESTSE